MDNTAQADISENSYFEQMFEVLSSIYRIHMDEQNFPESPYGS